jgi:hypothetical protein
MGVHSTVRTVYSSVDMAQRGMYSTRPAAAVVCVCGCSFHQVFTGSRSRPSHGKSESLEQGGGSIWREEKSARREECSRRVEFIYVRVETVADNRFRSRRTGSLRAPYPCCGEERRWTEKRGRGREREVPRGEQQVVREKEEERSHTHTQAAAENHHHHKRNT